ncbi:MAG: hypothetical protein NZ518_09180 [Dehalococcoidia bacterium]|nr:hypothetical protein [Dehalococcoidia bacterium]
MGKRIGAAVAVLAILAVMGRPAAAQQPESSPFQTRELAVVTQRVLPIGRLVWQVFAYDFSASAPPTRRGDDIGFVWARAGRIAHTTIGQPTRILTPGEAAGAGTGEFRSFGPSGGRASAWLINFGGPTPPTWQQSQPVLFQSEVIAPPGPGPYTLRLTEAIVRESGVLPPVAADGVRTLFLVSGAAILTVPDGGAVIDAGFTATLPLRVPIAIQRLSDAPAFFLIASVAQDTPAFNLPTPSTTITLPPQSFAPIGFPVLPVGTFPRMN